MSKIVELSADEVTEVTGGKGIIKWLEGVFGGGDPPTGVEIFNGIKG